MARKLYDRKGNIKDWYIREAIEFHAKQLKHWKAIERSRKRKLPKETLCPS